MPNGIRRDRFSLTSVAFIFEAFMLFVRKDANSIDFYEIACSIGQILKNSLYFYYLFVNKQENDCSIFI